MELHNFPFPVPIELFKISMSSQKVRKMLNQTIRQTICQLATLDPESYFNKTSQMTREILVNNDFANNFGITLTDGLQNGVLKPLEIEGRVLPKPECVYTAKLLLFLLKIIVNF